LLLTTTPKPGSETTTGLTCVYDAWNRLVSASDGTTTVTYQYDGAGQKIERITGGTAEHYYYCNGEVVEVRDGSLTSDPSSREGSGDKGIGGHNT
jgi:YD repeat-containing protein